MFVFELFSTIGSKCKYGRFIDITEMVFTGRSILVTLESNESIIKHTFYIEFYFEFVNKLKAFLLLEYLSFESRFCVQWCYVRKFLSITL